MTTPVALLVPYDSIARDENQPRTIFDPKSLAVFAERLWMEGIQSPIVATPDGDGYKILHGERRWRASALNRDRAAQLLEQDPHLSIDHPAHRYNAWTQLPVIVNTEEIPSYLRRILQVGDNENHVGLTLYERAVSYSQAFTDSPFEKASEFCRAVGMNEKTFSGYKIVIKAHGPAKMALESGLICDIQAFRLFVQLPNEVQEALIDEANDRETTIGRKYLEAQLEAAKAAQEQASAGASSPPAEGSPASNAEQSPREDDPEDEPAAPSAAPLTATSPADGPRIDLDTLSWLDEYLEKADLSGDEDRHRVAAYLAVHEALTTSAALIAIYEPLPTA